MQAAYDESDPMAINSGVPRRRSRYRGKPSGEHSGDAVHVVDGDHGVRKTLSGLLAGLNIEHLTFNSATDYLGCVRRDTCACLILDIHLPDMSGLDLQRELGQAGGPPIIFISGYGDIPSIVRAFKNGALDFLLKPLDPHLLMSAIREAFTLGGERRRKFAELMELQRRFAFLTPREREVLPLVAGGMLNKQAAAFLGVTEVTLQVHRGQIMRKMQAPSFAELVRMAGKLGVPTPATAG